MLVVQTEGAPRPGGRLRRRPRRVRPEPTAEVPLTRATVVDGDPLGGEREAASWLEAVAGDVERRVAEVKAAVRMINRALSAHRAAARDPMIQDVGATQALAIRIGYGTGNEIAEGRWSEARQLAPPPRSRREEIDPQERVAAVLGGREDVHPAELLLLRARLDIEQGRRAEAIHQLAAARAALSEQPSDDQSLHRRIDEAQDRLDLG